MTMKFEKLLHGYMNPPQQGNIIRLPDYLFTHDVWQFVKIKNPISKEPGNRNMLVFKHTGAGDLRLAVYVHVLTFVNKEGVWIERDENLEDELTIPFFEQGLNKSLYRQHQLLVGEKVLYCNKTSNVPPQIPFRIYPMGYNNAQSASIIENLGGMAAISEKISNSFQID